MAERSRRPPRSVCKNTPLGGPARIAKVEPVELWRPGSRAALADVRWPNGATLNVAFLDPDEGWFHTLRGKVQQYAPEWSQYCSIEFAFVEGESDDITVRFAPDSLDPYGTYCSSLGTDSAESARAAEPSMYLVFDPDDPHNTDLELRRVILHEFGHALGLIHEHMRTDRPIVWNRSAVYKYYSQLTHGAWDRTQIDRQVMRPYDGKVVASSPFDPASIMMYPFPEGLASYEDDGKPFVADWNDTLSTDDVAFIASAYPKAAPGC